MDTLTESQRAVLTFIETYCRERGVSPSFREIQKHFGYKAVGTVQDHIRALREKGYLEAAQKKRRQARSLLPVHGSLKGVKRIAVYGEVAAGGPTEAEQVEIGTLLVEENKTDVFGLRVVGDSMIEIGIYEGDFLVVQRTKRAKEGDIVVALLDGETTVKRYGIKRGEVWLLPENQRLQPMPTKNRRFEIQGRVVGLHRKF